MPPLMGTYDVPPAPLRALFLALLLCAPAAAGSAPAPLPETLEETGFYALAKTEFAPSYPLWTDGAAKRRWIHLPAGTAIDKSDPQAWEFPVGTRLWKEFAYERRVETRFIERLADGRWRYAAYRWNDAGTHATLAPAAGAMAGLHRIPSRDDCVVCHEGPRTPVLGYSRVQLAGEARHAALGYLHGNCAHCHNPDALPGLGFSLAQPDANPAASTRFREQALARMKSHDPNYRMPPIGVRMPDPQGIQLVQRYLKEHP